MSDRYEIRRKIGQGGIGAVYHAFDTKLQRNVALKRMLPLKESRANSDAVKGLQKEASIISSLQNPNIITVYDAGSDDEGSFVVMELIEGQTLDAIVRSAALRIDDFVAVVEQSLGGLIAAQSAGLLHRDLKPKNIMVSWLPSGNFQLKILDFGLAKFSVQPSLQTVDHGDNILGSIHFMAPEQFERLHLDSRTDLYAMGCVYYFALTQKYPFTGENPAEVMSSHLHHHVKPISDYRSDLGPGYCDWIMRLISRNPDDRPEDARAALREFQAIDATTGTAPSPVETATPLATLIPELDDAATGTVTGPTGPITALHRAHKKKPEDTGPSTRVNVVPPAAPTGTAPRPLSTSRTPRPLLITAFAIIPAIALVIAVTQFKSRYGSDQNGSGSDIASPLPAMASRVAHFAADSGVLNAKGKPARPKERVAIWKDLAEDVSGNNALQHPGDATLMPALDFAPPSAGLNDRHPVVRFRKGEELGATRKGNNISSPLATSLDQDALSWFIVFKPAPKAGTHLVAALDQLGYPNTCVTWYRARGYQSGVRRKGKRLEPSITPCNLGSFILLSFVWDGAKGEQIQAITIPDGTRIPGSLARVTAPPIKINRLRLGGIKKTKPNLAELFAGDVAEFIVYNSALSEPDIQKVESYLFEKYFRK